MRKVFFILLCTSICYISHAQNLIRNPSFEMYTKRNNDGKDIRFCTGWEYSNSDGAPYSSPDLILATDSNDKLIRRFGLLPAHSGDCFGGFLTNEYLINTLNDPLEKDSLYLVSFWYCLPPHGFYYTQQFSYRFITEDSLFFHDPSVNAGKKKTLYNLMRNTMQDVECDSCKFRGWHKLQFYYKAKGNEAAFMFGIYSPMFPNDRKADNVELLPEGKIKLKTGEKNFGHYCYVDDFSIEKVTPPLAIGKILITRDILFASGSSTIEPKSFDYLNSLADYLLPFPDLKIEINGHTDNVGSATANQKLSEDRAEAVKNYLVSRGIISDRITTAGYGSNKLVDDNTTVEGRAQNRRIEIQISE